MNSFKADPQKTIKQTKKWRLAIILKEVGVLQNLETAIDNLASQSPQGERIKIAWENANTINRDSQAMGVVQSLLGVDDATADSWFQMANSIDI